MKAKLNPKLETRNGGTANRSLVSARTRLCAVLVVSGWLLAEPGEAPGADISVSTEAESVAGEPGVFNPRGIYGLKAVVSQSAARAAHYPTHDLQATADAAAYGSDSWRDGTGNPALEALEDLAVEPMANAQAHAFSTSPSENMWDASAIAGTRIRVHHRVVARSSLPTHLESLALIPVEFQFKLHVSVQGPVDQNARSSAEAYVEVYSPEPPLFVWWTNLSVDTRGGPLAAELSVTVTNTLRRHRTNDVHTYWVTADAEAHARSWKGVSAEAQGVADPLIQVDPDWEHALYFMVVQESLQRPGEWLEITREWENIVLRPTLTLTRTNSAMTLSWPADAGEFALQATTNLDSPATWLAVTNPPVLTTNAQWEVMLPATPASRWFYQLLSPTNDAKIIFPI
jgi:hypothetical protein